MNIKPLVIDSFPYNGEKVQLDIRFQELSSIVTKFLILESNRTQTGLKKPYYFEEQQEEFKDFAPQIVYVKLDDSNIDKDGIGEADWAQEFRVRRATTREGFQKLEETEIILLADSILICSDVDEIPRKECVQDFINSNNKIICLNHYFNSYYLNLYSRFREPWGWYGSILFRMGSLTNDIQYFRNVKDRLPHTGQEGEGWHFSNLLSNGYNSLYSKWLQNIEPHDKSQILGEENKERLKGLFEKCLYEDSHMFFCDIPDKREILLEKLDIDFLPDAVKDNQEKYKHLLLPYPEIKEENKQLNLI